MTEMKFSYDAQVTQTGLLSVTIPSHFVAILVAEKLGLPMPARNAQCEVNSAENGPATGGDHMVNIDFEYLARVETAPVTLSFPTGQQPPDETSPAQG